MQEISLVQNFAEMLPDPSEEFFTFFSSYTPTKWLPHLSLNTCKPGTSQVSQSTWQQSKEPSYYNNDGVFLSCRGNGQRPSGHHLSKDISGLVHFRGFYFHSCWLIRENFAFSETFPLYGIKFEQFQLDGWKESEQCKHLYGTLLSSQFVICILGI